MLWRDIQDVFADSAFTSVEPLIGRLDRGESGNTPTDAWAFSSWTTRDAEGRLWGAAPGVIYIAGFAISTCRGRFDASNCGFGLPPARRANEDYRDGVWAIVAVDISKLSSKTRRINITLPERVLAIVDHLWHRRAVPNALRVGSTRSALEITGVQDTVKGSGSVDDPQDGDG